MVRKLADELTLILDGIENPGISQNAAEEPKSGLVFFCRGLVVGLRASEEIAQRNEAMMSKQMDAPTDARLHPIDEALKDCGCVPDCH